MQEDVERNIGPPCDEGSLRRNLLMALSENLTSRRDIELLFDGSRSFSSACCVYSRGFLHTRMHLCRIIRHSLPPCHYRCIISSYHSLDADFLHCKIRTRVACISSPISSPCYRSRMRASEIGFNGPRPMYARIYRTRKCHSIAGDVSELRSLFANKTTANIAAPSFLKMRVGLCWRHSTITILEKWLVLDIIILQIAGLRFFANSRHVI